MLALLNNSVARERYACTCASSADPLADRAADAIEHLKLSDRAAQLEALKSLNKLRRVDEQSVMEEAPLNEFLMVELRWGLGMLRPATCCAIRLRRRACCGASCRREVDAAAAEWR